jgi:hypothetical protein
MRMKIYEKLITYSISFIVCFGVPIDSKNGIHTLSIYKGYSNKPEVSKYPIRKHKTRNERLHVKHN